MGQVVNDINHEFWWLIIEDENIIAAYRYIAGTLLRKNHCHDPTEAVEVYQALASVERTLLGFLPIILIDSSMILNRKSSQH